MDMDVDSKDYMFVGSVHGDLRRHAETSSCSIEDPCYPTEIKILLLQVSQGAHSQRGTLVT